MLIIPFVFYVGGIAFLHMAAYFIKASITKSRVDLRNATRSAFIAVAVGGLYPVHLHGKRMLKREIVEAKAYCEKLIADGTIKQDGKGFYPESQEELSLPKPIPRLLLIQRRGIYRVLDDGRSYRFHIGDGGFGSYYELHMGTNHWRRRS